MNAEEHRGWAMAMTQMRYVILNSDVFVTPGPDCDMARRRASHHRRPWHPTGANPIDPLSPRSLTVSQCPSGYTRSFLPSHRPLLSA